MAGRKGGTSSSKSFCLQNTNKTGNSSTEGKKGSPTRACWGECPLSKIHSCKALGDLPPGRKGGLKKKGRPPLSCELERKTGLPRSWRKRSASADRKDRTRGAPSKKILRRGRAWLGGESSRENKPRSPRSVTRKCGDQKKGHSPPSLIRKKNR